MQSIDTSTSQRFCLFAHDGGGRFLFGQVLGDNHRHDLLRGRQRFDSE